MQEDLQIQTRGTPKTRFARRLRIGVASAAVLVASFASAPLAGASVPRTVKSHSAAVTAVAAPQLSHWGCPAQGVASGAPVSLWPHWGCPLAFIIKGSSLWPHWGGPVHGARSLWPHWGGPVRGAQALWPHWGGPVNGDQALWPHWGGPVR
jgi:hypothetical protein